MAEPPSPQTLDRFLSERCHDARDRELASLIDELAVTSLLLAHEISGAPLAGRRGLSGAANPSGEAQKQLDVVTNDIVVSAFQESDAVAAIVSEELEAVYEYECCSDSAYILAVDPLDGSSNADVNGVVGTVFGFYRRPAIGICNDVASELQRGARLVAAGYVMYGPSTTLVFTIGHGVHGFTLEPLSGRYLATHLDLRHPPSGGYLSANVANYAGWSRPARVLVDGLLAAPDPKRSGPSSLRYSGALVADLHRNLLEGGTYLYPADAKNPEGKLRLVYECLPMALLVEQAGGRASTGSQRVLDLQPEGLHQTCPLIIGGAALVAAYEALEADAVGGRSS